MKTSPEERRDNKRRNRSNSYVALRSSSGPILSEEDQLFIPSLGPTPGVVSIKSIFYKEVTSESISKKRYLDSEQRKAYKIHVENGLFKDAKGYLLNGCYLYIMLPNFELYAAKEVIRNHSHLSSGLDLKGAGFLYFHRGILICFSNDSGHYKPTTIEMLDAINWFYQQSANPYLIFEDHAHQIKNAPYLGIQFNLVRLQQANAFCTLQRLSMQELVWQMSMSWNRANRIADDILSATCAQEEGMVGEETVGDELSDDFQAAFPDLTEYDFDAIYETEMTKPPILDPNTKARFENIPKLAYLTCIGRLFLNQSREFSHFNAFPRAITYLRDKKDVAEILRSRSQSEPTISLSSVRENPSDLTSAKLHRPSQQ